MDHLTWEAVAEEGGLEDVTVHKAEVPGGWLYRMSKSRSYWDKLSQAYGEHVDVLGLTFVPEAPVVPDNTYRTRAGGEE